MTPEQQAEFDQLNSGGMTPEQRAEFDRINTPVEQTFSNQAGDVGTAAMQGLANTGETVLDLLASPYTVGARHLTGLKEAFTGEGRWQDANERYMAGFGEDPTVGGVPVGEITHATVNPSGMSLKDPNYQPSAEREYNIPEEQAGPGLRRAKRAARLGTEFASGAVLGPSKYIKPALKALPLAVGLGTEGGEQFGTGGEIAGLIGGALASDPKSVAQLAKLVYRGGAKAAGNVKGLVNTMRGRKPIDPNMVSDNDARMALQEMLANVYPDDPAKIQQAMDDLPARLKQAVDSGELGTAGQITNDLGLMRMEQTGAKNDLEVGALFDQMNARLKEAATAPVREVAKKGVAADAGRVPRNTMMETARLERSMASNMDDAAKAPFKTAPTTAEASTRLAKTVGKARDEAFADAKKAWAAVPDGEIPATAVQQKYLDFWNNKNPNAIRLFEQDFPGASTAIYNLDGNVDLDTLSDVISKLSKESKGTSTSPEIISGIQDALYSSLDDIAGGASAARKSAASQYKNYMDQYGKRSVIGKALAGDAETVAQQLLPTGDKGVARLNKLIDTGSPQAITQAEDYIRAVFRDTVLEKPNVTPAAIATFRKKFGNQLDMLPDGSTLKADIQRAEDSIGYVQKAEGAAKLAETSAPARLGEAGDRAPEVVKQLKKTLNSSADRSKPLGQIWATVSDNPKAKEDFRRAALDELADRVYTKGSPDIDSLKKFSTERDLYEDAGIFTRAELDRIEDGLFEGKKLFAGQDAKRLAKLPPKNRRVAEAIAALAGAKTGALAFGSPLIGAALGRKAAVRMLSELTTEKASRLAYEMSINPERFVDIYEMLNKKTISDAEIGKALNSLFARALTATKPPLIEANAGE